jgi:adenine deaminase
MKNHNIARGDELAPLVLKNCSIIDVFTHQIEQNDIAINDGIIIGVGQYNGKTEIDCTNLYVSPGFIDGHVHIESSMLTPSEFSKIILPKGTTRVIADPHEIANVQGIKGIGYMFKSSQETPLNVHLMIPSCVPATKYENSGATISNEDIYSLKNREGILGLGEVMDYPSVIHAEKNMMDKLAVMQDKIIDGHAPGITGNELNAYLLNHIQTDHECTTVEELNEKVSRGVYVHLREGSATRNVRDLAPGVNQYNSHRLLLCTDDKHPMDIVDEGHINYNINVLIEEGVDPITAIQMATINIANCYQLKQVGAVAPGYIADLVLFDNLQHIDPKHVIVNGKFVVKNKKINFTTPTHLEEVTANSVKLNPKEIHFTLSLKQSLVKVMQLIPNNVTTNKVMREVLIKDGKYINNPKDDILKIAVIERHHYTQNIGIGLIEGYGLRNAAVAMTVAHDSHNLIVVGDNDEDMLIAANTLHKSKGGLCLVSQGKIIDTLPLEIAGLMTNKGYDFVHDRLLHMENEARKLGVNKEVDDAFLSLAFMSLPVIPELKITDIGLFDVTQFKLVDIEGES